MSDILNPFRQCIYINSYNRTSGTSDNFTISLNSQLTQLTDTFDTVVLLAASIPKSYYLINNNNSTFGLSIGTSNYLITIPIGNYNVYTLATALNTAFNAITAGITSAINLTTGCYTFTSTGIAMPSDITVSFIFNNSTVNICYILGFLPSTTYVFSNISGTYILTAPNVCNLQLTDVILICSDFIRANSSILSQVIPSSSNFASILFNEPNPAYSSKAMNNLNATSIRLWLLDSDGNPINLNGQDWQCTICLYKANQWYYKDLLDKLLTLPLE